MKKWLIELWWNILYFLEDVSSFISKHWLSYSVYMYAILATLFLIWLF